MPLPYRFLSTHLSCQCCDIDSEAMLTAGQASGPWEWRRSIAGACLSVLSVCLLGACAVVYRIQSVWEAPRFRCRCRIRLLPTEIDTCCEMIGILFHHSLHLLCCFCHACPVNVEPVDPSDWNVMLGPEEAWDGCSRWWPAKTRFNISCEMEIVRLISFFLPYAGERATGGSRPTAGVRERRGLEFTVDFAFAGR
jgi:hypothetical protein